jgi:hypothetical protein
MASLFSSALKKLKVNRLYMYTSYRSRKKPILRPSGRILVDQKLPLNGPQDPLCCDTP